MEGQGGRQPPAQPLSDCFLEQIWSFCFDFVVCLSLEREFKTIILLFLLYTVPTTQIHGQNQS